MYLKKEKENYNMEREVYTELKHSPMQTLLICKPFPKCVAVVLEINSSCASTSISIQHCLLLY